MIGHPFFLSKESKQLLDMCNKLVCGMKKYLDFLSEQKERTAFNHQKPEAVRGLNDKWSLRKLDISQGVNKNYLEFTSHFHNFNHLIHCFCMISNLRINLKGGSGLKT